MKLINYQDWEQSVQYVRHKLDQLIAVDFLESIKKKTFLFVTDAATKKAKAFAN
jgi:hypothetical protein